MIAYPEFKRTSTDDESGPVIWPAVVTEVSADHFEGTSFWACRVAHKFERQAPNLTLLLECPSGWDLPELKGWLNREYPNYLSFSWLQIDLKIQIDNPPAELSDGIPF